MYTITTFHFNYLYNYYFTNCLCFILQNKFAVDFIRVQTSNTPFLMVLAPPAAHAPFNPAPRHNDKYKGTTAKRTPSFNHMEERVYNLYSQCTI